MAGDLPDFFTASGWQDTDDEHPPGEGVLAYRVVFKTLKTHLPEVVEEMFFVELVLHTTEERPDRRLAEGRTRLASLKTFIELTFGPRVLGALVTEGLGEVFPDGHFNRGLESERVGNEYQMGLAAVTPEEFSAWTSTTLAKHLARPPEELRRIGLACDWYWRSTQTADLVTEDPSLRQRQGVLGRRAPYREAKGGRAARHRSSCGRPRMGRVGLLPVGPHSARRPACVGTGGIIGRALRLGLVEGPGRRADRACLGRGSRWRERLGWH